MDTVDGKSNARTNENQTAPDVSGETPPRTQLQHHIQSQRAQLLHADGEDAVVYAEAAHVAANLIINTVKSWIACASGRWSMRWRRSRAGRGRGIGFCI